MTFLDFILIEEAITLLGDCRDDNLIDHIFGSVSEFARQIEEHGDEFIYQGIKVTYDPNKDIHYFYSR
jgi:hypothetical protein